MSKVALAVPALAGLSGGTALAVGAGLMGGSALLDSYGQRKHAKRQDAANQQWIDYQNRKTRQFDTQEDANRERARLALDENLGQSDVDSRMETIDAETGRLYDEWTTNLPDIAGGLIGSGQGPGTSKVFDEAMARSLADATSESRKRIEALARATSYGSGSMGSMGMTDALRNQETGNFLGGVNQERVGDINTLRRYQSVQPEMLEYEQSPLVPIMNAAGSMILGGGGPQLADLFSGAVGPGMTTGAGLTANSGNLLPPMSQGAMAPGASMFGSLRPKLRPEQFAFRMGPGVPF